MEQRGGEWEQGGGTKASSGAANACFGPHKRLEEAVRENTRERGGETSGEGKGEGEEHFKPFSEAGGARGGPPAPQKSVFQRRTAQQALFYLYLRLE